jgi:hypothetical protein
LLTAVGTRGEHGNRVPETPRSTEIERSRSLRAVYENGGEMGWMDDRLAELIAAGDEITADTVTDNGRRTVDPLHGANGPQSAIGSRFRLWASEGLIVRTGRVVKSKAPKRKGGMIQIWEPTTRGVTWARDRTEPE